MSTAYDRRAAARRLDNERRLMGESLAAFHARETAPPPTLSEVYARNHTNRERCPWTADLIDDILAPSAGVPAASPYLAVPTNRGREGPQSR